MRFFWRFKLLFVVLFVVLLISSSWSFNCTWPLLWPPLPPLPPMLLPLLLPLPPLPQHPTCRSRCPRHCHGCCCHRWRPPHRHHPCPCPVPLTLAALAALALIALVALVALVALIALIALGVVHAYVDQKLLKSNKITRFPDVRNTGSRHCSNKHKRNRITALAYTIMSLRPPQYNIYSP